MSKEFNHQLARDWIYALRNGNYQKADGWLCAEDSFCALGVLADVALKRGELKGSWETEEIFPGMKRTILKVTNDPDWTGKHLQTLPLFLMQTLRMWDQGDFEVVQQCVEQVTPEKSVLVGYGSVSEANDRGLDFETIATMIEHYLFPEEIEMARISRISPYSKKGGVVDVEQIPF